MQDLSPEILKGVALLGNAKDVPETAFKPLTEMVFAILLRRIDETKISENPILSKLDPIVLKQAYSSLVSFVLEGAKINADPVVLKGVLEQENVDPQRATFITTLYSTTKEALRTILSTTTFHYPHITNIDWRLDYFIKSNAMEKSEHSYLHDFFGNQRSTTTWNELRFIRNRKDGIYMYFGTTSRPSYSIKRRSQTS